MHSMGKHNYEYPSCRVLELNPEHSMLQSSLYLWIPFLFDPMGGGGTTIENISYEDL